MQRGRVWVRWRGRTSDPDHSFKSCSGEKAAVVLWGTDPMEADSDFNVHKDQALSSLASFTLEYSKQKFTKGMFWELSSWALSYLVSSPAATYFWFDVKISPIPFTTPAKICTWNVFSTSALWVIFVELNLDGKRTLTWRKVVKRFNSSIKLSNESAQSADMILLL